MKKEQLLLTVSETTHFLSNALGPAQNWENVLNDFRQHRRDFKCDPLMPLVRAKRGKRAAVPLYRPCDIEAFIEAVRNVHGVAKPYPLRPQKYLVDDDEEGGYWFTRVAIPVTGAGALSMP